MTEALMQRDVEALMPVMSIETATERYRTIVHYVKELMNEGTDYGKIPGTEKNTLLKPGAEKLCTLFGLSKRFILVEHVEDWRGDQFGEPFFNYLYRCGLYRGEYLIAEADGSCNSRETKYRWRQGERLCPGCEKPAIIKGKAEYGGGWLCFTKKGGCGAKFNETDERITSQQIGRVANPDIADQVNTIQKMAQKRAMIAATLLAVNASEFFTQDLEDFVDVPVTGNGDKPNSEQALRNELVGKAEQFLKNSTMPAANRKKALDRLSALATEEMGQAVDKLISGVKAKQAKPDPEREELLTEIQEAMDVQEWDPGDVERYLKNRQIDAPLESLAKDQLQAIHNDLVGTF
jgi:hypothetical protein